MVALHYCVQDTKMLHAMTATLTATTSAVTQHMHASDSGQPAAPLALSTTRPAGRPGHHPFLPLPFHLHPSRPLPHPIPATTAYPSDLSPSPPQPIYYPVRTSPGPCPSVTPPNPAQPRPTLRPTVQGRQACCASRGLHTHPRWHRPSSPGHALGP